MDTLKASQTRIPSEALDRVVNQRERVRIERRGGKCVFLVSEEDMEVLRNLEDRYWATEGRKALKEFEESGAKPIPWEKLKQKLGL